MTTSICRFGHAELAVAEIARAVLISGGTQVYVGRVKPSGFTQFLMHEVRRYGRSAEKAGDDGDGLDAVQCAGSLGCRWPDRRNRYTLISAIAIL